MLTLNRKENFPETPYCEDRKVNRDIVSRAVNHVIPQALGIVPSQQRDNHLVPIARPGNAQRSDSGVGLVTQVRHAVEHREESRDPDSNHYPFKINTIAHMRLGNCDLARAVKNGVHGLIKRIELSVAPSLGEMRF